MKTLLGIEMFTHMQSQCHRGNRLSKIGVQHVFIDYAVRADHSGYVATIGARKYFGLAKISAKLHGPDPAGWAIRWGERALPKFGRSEKHCRIILAFGSVYWCCVGPESRTGARKGSVVAEKTENYGVCEQQGRGEPRSKSPILICAAGCFRLLRVLKGMKSVRNHETGLEGGQY